MPAAAVIPAPIAYINVVAVKKLVVEFLGGGLVGFGRWDTYPSIRELCSSFTGRCRERILYLEKIRVFQAGHRRNTLAWNNGIGLWSILLVIEP